MTCDRQTTRPRDHLSLYLSANNRRSRPIHSECRRGSSDCLLFSRLGRVPPRTTTTTGCMSLSGRQGVKELIVWRLAGHNEYGGACYIVVGNIVRRLFRLVGIFDEGKRPQHGSRTADRLSIYWRMNWAAIVGSRVWSCAAAYSSIILAMCAVMPMIAIVHMLVSNTRFWRSPRPVWPMTGRRGGEGWSIGGSG